MRWSRSIVIDILSLVGVAASILWMAAPLDRDAPAAGVPVAPVDPPPSGATTVAPVSLHEPARTPTEIATSFGHAPPQVASAASPVVVATEPAAAVAPVAHHVRITGSVSINGHRLVTAIDARRNRAVLIGPAGADSDWEIVEERTDALVVNTGSETIAVPRVRS